MLEVGTKAPEFTLPDKDGNPVSLTDFAGKKVVLYFYPKDNTPGCTRQACAFAGAYPRPIRLTQKVFVVAGVSLWGTMGRPCSFAFCSIFLRDSVAQIATTGDSTKVSVLITCMVFLSFSLGSSWRAYHTS